MAEPQSPNFNPTEPGYTPNSGNTNSGNTSSGNDTPPTQNTPTPIPTPTTEPIPNDIIDTIEDLDGDGYVESVRPDIKSGREQFRSIRDRFSEDDEVVIKESVGDFDINGLIRLYRDSLIPEEKSVGTTWDSRRAKYPQISIDFDRYDIESSITVIDNPDINFDFILCLKDGTEGIPDLYATKKLMDILADDYYNQKPFAVNSVIQKENIVVVDIKPLKEKVEALRAKELSINLNRNEIAGQVEVRKNVFVYSNYQVGSGGVLEATPTYDIIELIKYISWVVTKPAANYDDRLIPANTLGDFDGYSPEEESVPADSPSEQTDTQTTDTGDTPPPPPGQYTPIGRMGTSAGETVFKDGDYWEWDAEFGTWILDRGAGGRRDYID
jgi:hypothetical protein